MEDEHGGEDDHNALEGVGKRVCYRADLVQHAEGELVVQVEQHACTRRSGKLSIKYKSTALLITTQEGIRHAVLEIGGRFSVCQMCESVEQFLAFEQ